jgi:hypothetical protein
MAATLEERVTELEKKMALVLSECPQENKTTPWWEAMFGMFADSEEFEEAVRAGREYREAQHPEGEDE